jgi:hypothetical protein
MVEIITALLLYVIWQAEARMEKAKYLTDKL